MGSDFFHGFTHCEALLLRNARTYRCWLWTRVLGDRTSDLDSVGHRPPFSKLHYLISWEHLSLFFLVAVYQRRSIVTELWCELVGVDQLLRRAV